MPRYRLIAYLSAAAIAFSVVVDLRLARGDAAALYADQEYEQAVVAADATLAGNTASRTAKITALRIKGAALAVLGRDADASAAFTALLDMDPAFQLPAKASPRIRGVFGSAQATWEVRREGQLAMKLGAALTALKLGVQQPMTGRGGRPYRVRVALADPKGVAKEVVLYYRRVGTQRYSSATIAAKHGSSSIAIPGAVTASPRAYQLELYVQVVHGSGVTLRRHGRPAKPLRVSVSAGRVPKPTPIVKRWWFWAGVAAVVLSVPFVVDQMRDVGPQEVTGTIR